MSSDEDDYMSAKFLENAEEFESKRKEETYSERRKKQIREQEKKSYIKPRAQLEAEEREKGLQRSLDEDKSNKGMKMLMKMGFKKGNSLGSGKGIVEPIKINMRSGRYGIGLESELQKRTRELEEEEEEEEIKRRKTEMDPREYRVLMAQRAKENQLIRYLLAAVSICEKLDEDNNIKSNIIWTLKPIQPSDNDINETNDIEDEDKDKKDDYDKEKNELLFPKDEIEKLQALSLDEQLETTINYLREIYHYCFWCRAKYTDKNDLDINCPGPDEDSH
ncbi:MAG: hypothetical protein EXX96DRAFT_67691 [Benjaminiella poitrasii]|nr:MAG: hypothetical protein EXX96DRAFT_67691 [Benjaminiella poitrasii]